jgi:uncharacterized protein YwgA
MIMDASDVARIVQLNGGQLIGKTRLQKSAYFLEAKKAGFGFDFSYHHFGPYSEDLANSADDARALGLIEVNWKESQGGTRYAIFYNRSADDENPNDALRRKIFDVLKRYSSVEVELAATADFLMHNGYSDDPWSETRRRKATKVDEGRLAKAQQLLRELDAVA